LKTIAQMDTADRRKPQKGTVKASVDNHRHELEVSTAGSASGESLRVTVDPRLRHTTKLADLGFSADQLNLLRDSIADGTGIVLLTSPKGQGLTALEYALLSAHDAFISHIQTVERAPERDLDGITQNKLPVAATAAQELDMTNWVISQDTDVLLVAGLEDPKSAHQLSKFAKSGKRIYIGMRAPNTLDALLAWRKLVGDDTLAMQSLKMIIASRVVRRLCSACKIGYQPDPEQLRRLNMDPARVGQLYQARTEPMRDAKGRPVPCEFCHDLRFKGRLGFYEIFLINDDVRQVVMSGGSLKQLQAAFRKQRGKFLQEEALLHVESGATSVQEVLRVMRASEGQPPAPAAAAATAQRSG
ncbi:MAG TPA: ATPase, T2SS/T4P/T4SS family, partial [Tepidisphaeraceae bacterium]